MNVHFFLRALKCPRSAALRYARYSTLWNRSGYPERPSVPALAGTAVHVAVARVASALAKNGCTSAADPRFFSILKNLGGYSTVIKTVLREIIDNQADNPRFQNVRETCVSLLNNRIPQLRESVQIQLSRLTWEIPSEHAAQPPCSKTGALPRRPLSAGSHFEVELRSKSLKWRGIADLIELTDSTCDLTDFKNGNPSDDHLFQLRVYALLWNSDEERNPNAVPIRTLRLSYPFEDREIAFDESDRQSIESTLASSTPLVRESIQGPTSKAVLDSSICPDCDVRQLCSEYWTSARPIPTNSVSGDCFDDIQILLMEKKGQSTWLASVQSATYLKRSTAILFRFTSSGFGPMDHLTAGTILRLTGALVSETEGSSPVVSCLGGTDWIILNPEGNSTS